MSQELNSLLRVMWSGKMSMVSPHKMLYAVWNSIPFFKGYSQQDAHEFLRYVVVILPDMSTPPPGVNIPPRGAAFVLCKL